MTHAKGVFIFIRGACERAAGHGQMQTIIMASMAVVGPFADLLPEGPCGAHAHHPGAGDGGNAMGPRAGFDARLGIATERDSAKMAQAPKRKRRGEPSGCPQGSEVNNTSPTGCE